MREWLSWWSATLPRSRPRVRVPSRALNKTGRKPRNTMFPGFFFAQKYKMGQKWGKLQDLYGFYLLSILRFLFLGDVQIDISGYIAVLMSNPARNDFKRDARLCHE